jgi:uncharacterized membrane protein YoaK (UPF0700 family)
VVAEGRAADVVSVGALFTGFVLSLGLAFAAFVTGLCSLFGEECTSAEQGRIRLLGLASLGVFVVVPVAVAIVRGQGRWLLAPVIEAALLVVIVAAK